MRHCPDQAGVALSESKVPRPPHRADSGLPRQRVGAEGIRRSDGSLVVLGQAMSRCNLCLGNGRYHHPTCPRYLGVGGCRCGMPRCPVCRWDAMSVLGVAVALLALLALLWFVL